MEAYGITMGKYTGIFDRGSLAYYILEKSEIIYSYRERANRIHLNVQKL